MAYFFLLAYFTYNISSIFAERPENPLRVVWRALFGIWEDIYLNIKEAKND